MIYSYPLSLQSHAVSNVFLTKGPCHSKQGTCSNITHHDTDSLKAFSGLFSCAGEKSPSFLERHTSCWAASLLPGQLPVQVSPPVCLWWEQESNSRQLLKPAKTRAQPCRAEKKHNISGSDFSPALYFKLIPVRSLKGHKRSVGKLTS